MIPHTTKPEQKVEIYRIATEMSRAGLPALFVASIVEMASEYEGTFSLMELWAEEKNAKVREEIISDLQDEIDSHAERKRGIVRRPKISFDELEGIAAQIMKFKKELREKVDRWGGISKLAESTEIPQPSLSRFFNTPSMPRRITLYKIANAMKLSESDIRFPWAA